MSVDQGLMYVFSLILLISAFQTIRATHVVKGALYLASAMISMAGIFFLLGAHFIAWLQLIIYAGAVIVLFVMVLMLFDFKEQKFQFQKEIYKKAIWPLFLFGLVSGVIALMSLSQPVPQTKQPVFSVQHIASQVFHKYVFVFEMLGYLFLLVAIGAVLLVRLDRKE